MLELLRQLNAIDPQLELHGYEEETQEARTKVKTHIRMTWNRPIPPRISRLLQQAMMAESQNESHELHEKAMEALRAHIRLAIYNHTHGKVDATVLKTIRIGPDKPDIRTDAVQERPARRIISLKEGNWRLTQEYYGRTADKRASGLSEHGWKARTRTRAEIPYAFNADRTGKWTPDKHTSREAPANIRNQPFAIVLETRLPTETWQRMKTEANADKVPTGKQRIPQTK